MTSAAPQKRMVSSVFITLSSPHRATVTQQQQQHACKTRHAPARGAQHAAVRVHPGGDGGGMLSPGHRKGSASSESQGGTAQNGSWQIPARPRTPSDTPPPAPAAGLPDPVLDPNPPSRLERQDPRRPTLDQPPEELFPPPPPPPMPVDAELSGPAAALPLPPSPPEQPPPSAPLTPAPPAPPPPSNKQDTIVETEKITPSSGGDVQSSPVHTSMESREVCGFCRKPVALSEPAIEALNRTYHDGCFQCRQCHIPLAGKLYYNKAGIPLCEDCYQASLELCWACGEVIRDHVIRALERTYHPPCFICATCSQPIGEQRFAQGEVGEVYCLQDYYGKYAPRCSACQQLIIPREDGTDSYTVECLGRSFHEDCYRCEVCLAQLSPEPNDQGCHPLDGRVLCKVCHLTLVQSAQL